MGLRNGPWTQCVIARTCLQATGAIKPTWQSMRNTLAEQVSCTPCSLTCCSSSVMQQDNSVLALQVSVGFLLGTGLSAGGFLRVYATNGSTLNAAAIALSLWLIVMTSVLLGTALPFVLTRVRLPACQMQEVGRISLVVLDFA